MFYKALDNFQILPNMPSVLVGFTVGSDAKYIEKLYLEKSEDCLKDVIHELFGKVFPKLNLPRPTQIIM
jgi:hypothetical protein